MNAASNGYCVAAHSNVAGDVCSDVASRRLWLMLCALVMAWGLNGCVATDQPVPRSVSSNSTTQIAIIPPIGQSGPMSRLLADSIVTALIHRGFSAKIADNQPALFTVSGQTETLGEQYAPVVAGLRWILHDQSGTEIAYLNQRVQGERNAWAYGSPAMLQAIGDETAADLTPFLGHPATPIEAIVQPTKPATQATPFVTEETEETEETKQLAHSSDLVPMVSYQGTPAPPPVVPAPPTSGGDRSFVDFGIWVDPVTGAPGNGNEALTNALLSELRRAATPFAMTAGTASHFVQGVVDVSVLNATTEHVTILWVVSNDEGEELGRITQRNTIKRGTLHQDWGNTAQYAAIGGAEAVIAILERDLAKQ